MSHIFSKNCIEIPESVLFPKKMKVLITIVSSNINEVTRVVLNSFIQKLHHHKKAQNAHARKKIKKYS